MGNDNLTNIFLCSNLMAKKLIRKFKNKVNNILIATFSIIIYNKVYNFKGTNKSKIIAF